MPGVELNHGAIQALILGPGGIVERDLEQRCIRVESLAKQLCPVDNGLLRASITHEVVQESGLPVGRVGSNLYYALFRHEGTGIYGPRGAPIVPVNGTVLRWPTRGTTSSRPSRIAGRGNVRTRSQTPTGFAFATSVKGTPGVPFLRDALVAAA